jgi:hypothetical protein
LAGVAGRELLEKKKYVVSTYAEYAEHAEYAEYAGYAE